MKPVEAAEAFAKGLAHIEAGHLAGEETLPVLVSAAKFYREQGKSAEAQKPEERASGIREQHKEGLRSGR